MSKTLEDYEATNVRNFLEENWSDFVSFLELNYDEGEDAEEIAAEIVEKLV